MTDKTCRFLLKTFLSLALLTAASSGEAATGREILEKMEEYQRSITDSAFVKSRLSSCKYGLKDKKITCAESPRVKILEAVGINDGAERKDTKSVTLVLAPPAEKGIGMLNFTYDEAGRDNETWLYLSALGAVKRIANGNPDEDSESASIFGSEFTVEDLDTGKLDEYEINILEETTEGGREVWKIETVPNPDRAKKTRYGRRVLYVDKERYVPLRVELYDKQGKEIKRLLSSNIEQINDVWIAKSQTMMNLVDDRLSNLARLKINIGVSIPDGFLSQRTLTDAAFREAKLGVLRTQVE
ncbi:putative uncharacterized protein [Methylocaldum marinum]|uniref:Uncharacterized protein TP-0789 domain-containing protein n=1 Tax=Methylocaldum marinum TaxID=1432792 RepID=A0A250KY51_9GAMM|nr:outer membrane lipoprotein-sorting protein [Methylocaldum marinum]BBA36446.1 putative uncharacterized protein [Methylocaldum marinum]